MKYIFLLLMFFSCFSNAESFFSGEPDEAEIKGAFVRAMTPGIEKKGAFLQLQKFKKIDCVKESPKIFRCNIFYKATVGMQMMPAFSQDIETTESGRFTKLNGQWTAL
jgi:hypothetical protein